jgi:peptidyl-dipeptidase A
MWAQNWGSLFESTKPFPEGALVDVTQKMVDLNWNALRMFEESDKFYMSMGLPSSNMSFSEDAMIEKPEGRNVACHASAWDFCDGEDFR